MRGRRPFAGGRGGKERAASLRAKQRLAPGGAAPLPRRTASQRNSRARSAPAPKTYLRSCSEEGLNPVGDALRQLVRVADEVLAICRIGQIRHLDDRLR